ncbi:CsbD family protein [Marinactinospora thermotolerans]|uniref:CsbD-like n=1 Tax=Marinactinospora thermotolerans DSM 45154 TaxID=1122192 RepID=A0A1T4SYI3_9ACTN|nr:CsbD family protein [Marinactinospora thermotolerans]SKA32971.1 CsbD-like [Marinactinospora thermotolerans DSM 45154]
MGDGKAQGKGEQIKGKLKEAAGKAVGDERLKAEGKTEQAKGNVRETAQNAEDTVRGTIRGARDDKR